MLLGLKHTQSKRWRRYADFIYVKGISIKRAKRYPRHRYLVEASLGSIEDIRYSIRLAKTLRGSLVARATEEGFGYLAYKAFQEGIEVIPRCMIGSIERLEDLYNTKKSLLLFSGKHALRLFFLARSLRGA